MLPDVSTAEPRFTLAQVVDLERPAWHLTPIGHVDYLYDGINFWCERIGRACPLAKRQALPREGWRHSVECRCPDCREV